MAGPASTKPSTLGTGQHRPGQRAGAGPWVPTSGKAASGLGFCPRKGDEARGLGCPPPTPAPSAAADSARLASKVLWNPEGWLLRQWPQGAGAASSAPPCG